MRYSTQHLSKFSKGIRHHSSRRRGGIGIGRHNEQKQKELLSALDSFERTANENVKNDEEATVMENFSNRKLVDADMTKKFAQERDVLFKEAGEITKSLYRTCLRCIKLIREGNDHDEEQFKIREAKEKEDRGSSSPTLSFSFEPSVDRENELASRALYYLAFAKESFNQEVDCLYPNPWKEDNVERFNYLIRQGIERRKWILNDYKFNDPYPSESNALEERISIWEESAKDLIHQTYHSKGWLKQEDYTKDKSFEDDGIDWDDLDDDEDDNSLKAR